ncbi:MAG TPA: glutamyl-tRNA reductase [Longimicrobiales bacterium]
MPIAVIGLSHRTAPIEVRERFVFSAKDAEAALLDLVGRGVSREAVLLSTCNRTELYLGEVAEAGEHAGAALLAARAGLPEAEAKRYLYVHRDRRSVEHLFRVVSSLDSMILGEAQIQGQVKGAYEAACAMGGGKGVVGPALSRLFETALAVGGKVRSETRLGEGAVSVPGAAIELARKVFGSLRGLRALVLGAGEMSELMVACLQAEGAHVTVVASRSEARARELAARRGAAFLRFEEVWPALAEADIVASATGAPHVVLTREAVARALPGGARKPLCILDIALPRDVEPEVGDLENVFLYDIDDLEQIVEGSLARRLDEVPAAERIVLQAAADYWSWYTARDVVPVIRSLRERVEVMRRKEVEKTLARLGHLSAEDRAAVDDLTRRLLAKVLHRPTVRLREAAANGHVPGVAEAARFLFELDDEAEGGRE